MNNFRNVIIVLILAILTACSSSPPEPSKPSGSRVPVNPTGISLLDLD